MTWPPAASMRPAAAITSITMNGGTLLRSDAFKRPLARCGIVASSIEICYLARRPGWAAFPRLGRAYIVSEPRPMIKDRSRPGRTAWRSTISNLPAVVTAAALVLAPAAVSAQENHGPALLRD